MGNSLDFLVERLLKANRDYYDNGSSDLDDEQYNAMKAFVESQGVNISTLTPPPKGTDWPIVYHLKHMPSMSRCIANEKQYDDAYKDALFPVAGFYSHKYDGLSLELRYIEGELVNATLRGDGDKGEDVLPNVRHVPSIPNSIKQPHTAISEFAVYGELVVSWNNLDAINEILVADGKKPYSSPRSAVSMIRRKTGIITRIFSMLAFKPYDTCPHIDRTQTGRMDHLTSLNKAFGPVKVYTGALSQAWDLRNTLDRSRYPYQIDGIVLRDLEDQCVKIKFPAESAVTTVTEIVEQLGRTGVISPVVKFEPVKLIGANVRRATGHNANLMGKRLEGLGVGAKILVSRRGDVIPHIEEVLVHSEDPWKPTEKCPSCDAEVVQDGSIRSCSNDPSQCSGTAAGLIMKYCTTLGIDGFGPGVVFAAMMGGVNTPADLYMIDPELFSECTQPGGGKIGLTTAKKLYFRIQKRAELQWGELLGAIGIPGCASSVMEAVALAFPTPEDLCEVETEDLMNVDGIGSGRAESIASFIDTRWDEVIAPLLAIVHLTKPGQALSGKVFCITLGLKSCGRSELEGRIRQAGGGVKSSVSSKVTHLICNYPDGVSSKLKAAKDKDIPIISEETLMAMIGIEFAEDEDADVNADF